MKGKAQCKKCEHPLQVSATKDGCVCGVDTYNASVTTVRCVEDQFGGEAPMAPGVGCQKCPVW